jgi:ketosteroid isomerase-like protein
VASESSDLESRIAAIEHRTAIAGPIRRYAEAIRNCSLEDCLALLADDAFIELRHAHPNVPGGSEFRKRFEGREQILASFGDTAGQSARIWPMIHRCGHRLSRPY